MYSTQNVGKEGLHKLLRGFRRPRLTQLLTDSCRKVTGEGQISVPDSRALRESLLEIVELVVDLGGIRDGLCDLLVEDVPVAMAEAVNGHLDCPFRRFQLRRELPVRHLTGLDDEEALEALELSHSARALVLDTESREHSIEQFECPAPLVDPLRSPVV